MAMIFNVGDMIEIKTPDTVPFLGIFGFSPAKNLGAEPEINGKSYFLVLSVGKQFSPFSLAYEDDKIIHSQVEYDVMDVLSVRENQIGSYIILTKVMEQKGTDFELVTNV